jgi:hypothetical protein
VTDSFSRSLLHGAIAVQNVKPDAVLPKEYCNETHAHSPSLRMKSFKVEMAILIGIKMII